MNNSGMSLVAAIVAIGLLALATVGFMNLLDYMGKGEATIRQNLAIEEVRLAVNRILSSPVLCACQFDTPGGPDAGFDVNGVTGAYAPGNDVNPQSIRLGCPNAATAVATVGQPLQNAPSVTLTSISMTGTPAGSIAPITVTQNTVYSFNLQMVFTKGLQNAFGSNTQVVNVPVVVSGETNPAQFFTIRSCVQPGAEYESPFALKWQSPTGLSVEVTHRGFAAPFTKDGVPNLRFKLSDGVVRGTGVANATERGWNDVAGSVVDSTIPGGAPLPNARYYFLYAVPTVGNPTQFTLLVSLNPPVDAAGGGADLGPDSDGQPGGINNPPYRYIGAFFKLGGFVPFLQNDNQIQLLDPLPIPGLPGFVGAAPVPPAIGTQIDLSTILPASAGAIHLTAEIASDDNAFQLIGPLGAGPATMQFFSTRAMRNTALPAPRTARTRFTVPVDLENFALKGFSYSAVNPGGLTPAFHNVFLEGWSDAVLQNR